MSDRHRLLGRVRRPARARHAAQLEQALHHAGAGRHDDWAWLPAARSRPPARRQGGPRHHLRADSDQRRASTSAAPLPRGSALPKRPHPGKTYSFRWTSSSAGTRGRTRLAHADGVPGRRPRHFAAPLSARAPRLLRAPAVPMRASAGSSICQSGDSKASRSRLRASPA